MGLADRKRKYPTKRKLYSVNMAVHIVEELDSHLGREDSRSRFIENAVVRRMRELDAQYKMCEACNCPDDLKWDCVNWNQCSDAIEQSMK